MSEPWEDFGRPPISMPGGKKGTVYSIGVGDDRGEWVIPSIVDGKLLPKEEAIKLWRQGKNKALGGPFKTIEEGSDFAQRFHESEEKRIDNAPWEDFQQSDTATEEAGPWTEFQPRPQLQPGDLLGEEARQVPDLQATTRGGPPIAVAGTAETLAEPIEMISDIPRQVKELPRNLATGAEYVAAAGLNIPAAMYREATGVTPKIGVVKRDESGREVLAPEEAPLPFQPWKPVAEFQKTVMQPEGNAATRLVEGLLTPGMIATFPFAGSKAVQIAFLAHTVPGAIEAAEKVVAKDTPPDQRKEAATDLLVNGLMSYGLTRHLTGKPTEGVPNAPQERIEPESNLGERVGIDAQRQTAEAGGGNRPVGSAEAEVLPPVEPPKEVAAESERQKALDSKGLNTKISVRRSTEDGSWNVYEDIYESGRNEKVDSEFLDSFPTEEAALSHAAKLKKIELEASKGTPTPKEWEELLKPDVRLDLKSEGVTDANVEALLSGKKTPQEVVDEQLGIKKTGGSIDAETIIVEENSDGSRSIGFSPKAGPASTTPKNVGQMSHGDAIQMARDQGVERINSILEGQKKIEAKSSAPPIEPTPTETPPLVAEAATPPVSQSVIPSLFIKEGKQLTQVSPEQASQIMGRIRSETGAGASKLGNVKLYDANGKQVAYVSYNGNVWLGTESNPVHGKDSLIHNANGIEWNESSKSWDVPKPPGWDALAKTQDDLDRIRAKNRDENDAALAATNPEFAKLILQRDRLIRATMGNAKALDVKSAAPTPVEPKAPIPETVQPVIETPVETPPQAAAQVQQEVASVARSESESVPTINEIQAQRAKVKNLLKKIERQSKGKNAGFLPPPILAETRNYYATELQKLEGMESKLKEAELEAKRQADAAAEQFDKEQDVVVGKIQRGENVTQAEIDKYFNQDSVWRELAQEKGLVKAPPAPGVSPISEGPGAASPGDVPRQAQIEQLASAFKNINAKKAPLSERIKEAFDLGKQRDLSRDLIGRSLSALKTSGDYLIDTWKGVRDVDPILKVKGKLSSDLELRGWRMRQAMKDMKQAVPDVKTREAISKWVDAGGDNEVLRSAAETVPANRRLAYERAMNLTPEQKIFAEHIKSYFESRLQEAKDAGVLENGIEDYIHRIYPKETPWKKGVINAIQSGILNTRKPGLAMRRLFEFDSEAEKAGLNPVGDFIPRVLDYEASLSKVIASREAVKRFMEINMPDGRPMLDAAGIGVPIENAEGIREATLIKPSFKPGEQQLGKDGKPTLNYRRDYQSRDFGALKKWKWATKDQNGNPIYVQGDVLVHPDAVHRIDALLEPSKIRKYAAARAALAVGSTFKQTMLDFSGFHQVQIAIHGLEHKVNPFNLVKEIDAENPNVAGLLRGGVTLGGEHVTGLAPEGLVGRSLSRQIPGLGELMQTYHSWLFQDFIPRVKMTMALHALERNRGRFAKELNSGRMTEDALFYQTAKEANAAFGELNYVMLERSKTAQDMARLILLAPDFLEARGRFAGQSLTRLGGEQRMALWLGALTLYITARLMNKAISGEYHNEPENLFSVVHDGKAYSIRTVQGDVLHAIKEPVKFWLHRLNPTITRPLFELLSGRDEFGRKRDFWQVMGDTISNAIPISMRNSREQSIWTSLLNSFGGSVRRNSEVRRIYDAAQDWKKKNNVRTEPGEFIYDPSKDIYRSLKLAILDGDEAAAQLEYKKLIDSKAVTPRQAADHFKVYASSPFSGSKANESKFYKSLSEDQKKSYEGAKQEKQRILRGFIKAGGMSPRPTQIRPVTPQRL